jgi:GntR family transcriptional regulator, rspAB operon transcriptional repressor
MDRWDASWGRPISLVQHEEPVITEPASAASQGSRVALDLRTRQAAIYDTLLRMIVELELEPGRRLVEADLAAHFHVSKTPIREALLRLQSDELVQLAPYQGATVTWLSVEEYEELIYIQDSLEQPALPRISERATPRDLNELARLVKRLEQRREEHDSRGFFEVGAAIHQRLMGLAGPIRLVRIVMNLMGQTPRRYERAFVHQFDDAWDIELGIMRDRVAGIRAGDPDAAAAAVREGREAMLELIRSRLDHPDIVRYLAPSSEIQPRRMTKGRGGAKSRTRAVGDLAGSRR